MALGKLFPHNISIRASHNKGIVVNIGCAELVYPDTTSALIGVEKYMTDPRNKEKEYNEVCGGQIRPVTETACKEVPGPAGSGMNRSR